jgi:hypothetical protein
MFGRHDEIQEEKKTIAIRRRNNLKCVNDIAAFNVYFA